MIARLVPLQANEVIKALKKIGFIERRQTGSHLILRNSKTGKIIPVPIHKGRDLKTGTLRSIIRQSGLSVEEFFNILDDDIERGS